MSKLKLSLSSQVSNHGKMGFHTYHSAPNMKDIGKLTKIFTHLSLLQSTYPKAVMQFQMLMEFKCGARSNISLREQVYLPYSIVSYG